MARWSGHCWPEWCWPSATCCSPCCGPVSSGFGDVKLAGLAGLALGWLGWPTLALGAALGFVLCAVVSLGLLATRRIGLRSAICFGPFLLGGAMLAMLA